ncbi:MarR family winged helix-turn-helix transcriptional regulator [Thalassiella azotivora]
MPRHRWLTPDEQQVWRAYLHVTQRLWERLGGDLERSAGMPMPEYEILVRLSEAPDRCLRMSELAEQVAQSRSRLTHTVARMELRDLVTRRRCEDDGRGVLAELTDTGYDVLVEAAPVHVESVRTRLFGPLDPEEVATLGRLLDKLRQGIERQPGTAGDDGLVAGVLTRSLDAGSAPA